MSIQRMRASLVAGAILAVTLPTGASDAADPKQLTTSYEFNGDPVWSPTGDRTDNADW